MTKHHCPKGGPKVVLIGAGSVFFARSTVWSMVFRPAFRGGTLCLADVDREKLDWITAIAHRAAEATQCQLRIESATDYRELLDGADFIILAFATEGVKLRGVDAEISTRHGMTMCSADTVGPGGIMRTLREVPRQAEILQEVRKRAPNAWIINWVNPTAAMGIAMMRHFPDLKTMAICDGPHNPHFDDQLIVDAGIVSDKSEITDAIRGRVLIRSGGVNHFNWLVEMRYGGEDVTPRIIESLKKCGQEQHIATSEANKVVLTNRIAWQLASHLGYAPMCIWHTQEYLPFFQGHDIDKENALSIRQWRLDVREQWMEEGWGNMKALACGTMSINAFLESGRSDHALDIMEAMWEGTPKVFYLNTRNGGAVTNMEEDAYLEIPCLVRLSGIQPLPFGDMPRPILGYLQRVLDEHELAVEAAVTYDRDTLLKAFLASMVTVSIPDAKNCMVELLEAHRQYLPVEWFKADAVESPA